MKSGRIALTGRTKVMTKPEIMIPDELKQKAIEGRENHDFSLENNCCCSRVCEFSSKGVKI